ncbi:hypothetical protein [Anaerobutyricum hallii]|uniref:Uncharacterized protein n=1 Tax=Anaerobutyricum hallii TaxID=39488 RepID=A0A374N9K7_9FIRM|nr:hypothetical protein [Anaerobutyricum hallii]RGI80385.1 hypothetical protein DXD91_13760 [Anaerobutyricum hallii]
MSKKKSRVIKVNVIYGDKNLKDCMKQVIQKHERNFDLLTLKDCMKQVIQKHERNFDLLTLIS